MKTLVACLVCLVIVLGLVPTAVAHAAALAVTKCSFSPSSITLGAAGACRMCLVRDVDLAPDETVAPYPFSHTGDSTTAAVSFMPKIAGRYRLGLVFNGSNVWAHPNGPSRLVVRAAATTGMGVTLDGWRRVYHRDATQRNRRASVSQSPKGVRWRTSCLE